MSVVRLNVLGDCVIEVDENRVDPSSTHLFALLLVFALETDRRVPRNELQRLLFAETVEPQQASHNLRQLLYRVRRLGVALDESALGLRLPQGVVQTLSQQLATLTSGDCEGISAASVIFLPSYSPRLPRPFLDWLDRQRDMTEHSIRSSLLTASLRLQEAHAWMAAYRTSTILASLDPASGDAIAVAAESLAMLGRRQDALALINAFGDAEHRPVPTAGRLRSLSTRISRLGDTRTQSILRGRQDCLAALEAEWERLGPEGARRVTLIGPGGIGKTRVAEAFSARVRLLGGHVTRYTCDASSSEQPLGLFADILPELRGLRGSIGASPDLAQALDRLRPVVAPAELPTTFDTSVEAVRAEVQRALIDLLEAVSEEKPLLLLVDDAHFLDPVSANVIHAFCAKENTARLLVLLCARPSHTHAARLDPARRAVTYVLDPLPAEVCRQVVLDVAGPQISESHLDWCLSQAAGNPFYLHTLAAQNLADATLVPFDIRALAANAYSALASPTRIVLESCLFLGRLASISRVATVSGVSELELLGAVRELETLDLLTYVDGALSGPHALLQDALVSLIPSTVAALLHARIARVLEAECEVDQYVFSIAWAAAQSWLAAGDPHAAARLIRRCARQAAQIGETKVAIELVSRVVDADLPAALHASLLDELIQYAESSASPAILASASRTRLRLAKALGEDLTTIREFERRVVDADLMTGIQVPGAIDSLLGFLRDASALPVTRAQAAARLMMMADADFDTALAQEVYSCLPSIPHSQSEIKTLCDRAELIFHTFCGDASRARELSLELLRRFPQPSSTQECIKARTNAAFALHRLRESRAAAIFSEDYDWMMRHGIYKEALYCASLCTTIAVVAGDRSTASQWLAKSKLALHGEASHELAPHAGLYGDEAFLAMHEGRFEDAEPLIFAPAKDFAMLASDRHKAVSLAMWIRLKQLRGDALDYETELNRLKQLYTRGKLLGGQDLVLEALWAACVLAGDTSAASALLKDYLMSRRETGLPDWSLLHTTAADEAWPLRDMQ
jgi:Predicted ATPase